MITEDISHIILEETKDLQQNELAHLEAEFEDYKILYPIIPG